MIKLIVHNVIKHKFLFILIGLMVIMLCFYLIVGMNTVFSVSRSLQKAVAENMTGDVIITSEKVKRLDVITKDGEKKIIPLENWKELLLFLRNNKYIENASPRLRVWGLVKSDFNEVPMIITGVDPESEKDLLPRRKMDNGNWLTKTNEINLYYRHSDYLNVNPGAVLGIGVQTMDGYFNFDPARLVGVFDYEDLAYYTEFALYGFISLDYLNSLLMTKEPIAGEIFVRLKEKRDLNRVIKDVENNFGKIYRFILPQDSSNLVSGIYKLTYFTIYFIAFLLLLMVYLCSSFLVNLSIETRRQEIGIYMALGVKKWRIGLLFGGEFLLVMIFFGAIGTLLGLYIMQGISVNGIEATIIPLHLIFGRSILYIQNYPQTFIIISLILLLAFIGNTLNAIQKMSKLDPVEVMREL